MRDRIPAENLAIWRTAATENRELRHLQLSAMAAEAPDEALPDGLLSDAETGDGLLAAMAADERMAYCRALIAAHPTRAVSAPPPTSIPAAPRVATLSGQLFAAAFARFATALPHATPVYLSSLGELLEENSAGGADFAVFPIEDTKGTHFLHFYEEFDRLELSPVLGCSVSLANGAEGSRFLLLSRQYRPSPSPLCRQTVTYRLPGEKQRLLCELLTAADLAGLRLQRLDALPAPYPEDSYAYYPVFDGSDDAVIRMNTYIALFMPRAAVLAQYAYLNEAK